MAGLLSDTSPVTLYACFFLGFKCDSHGFPGRFLPGFWAGNCYANLSCFLCAPNLVVIPVHGPVVVFLLLPCGSEVWFRTRAPGVVVLARLFPCRSRLHFVRFRCPGGGTATESSVIHRQSFPSPRFQSGRRRRPTGSHIPAPRRPITEQVPQVDARTRHTDHNRRSDKHSRRCGRCAERGETEAGPEAGLEAERRLEKIRQGLREKESQELEQLKRRHARAEQELEELAGRRELRRRLRSQEERRQQDERRQRLANEEVSFHALAPHSLAFDHFVVFEGRERKLSALVDLSMFD